LQSGLCNCKPKFSLLGPPEARSLQGPASLGPRQPLHKWPPVKSAPTTRVSWYQNVSILDYIGANDDGRGGDNWSYKTWKALVYHNTTMQMHKSS